MTQEDTIIKHLEDEHAAQALAAVKAAVEPQIENLCENELLFKDGDASRREVLDAVYDIYRTATINNGVKMWRAWDTFDKHTHTCTISVEVFAGKERDTIKHVVGLKHVVDLTVLSKTRNNMPYNVERYRDS